MSSSNLVRVAYKKESSYGVTPPAVKASILVQDITYTAKKGGEEGDDLSIEYVDDGSAGAETVDVTGNKITVHIESGVSTATQINTAVGLSVAAMELITKAITGTAGTAQVTAAEANFDNGSGSFKTARFIAEKYSGTPETTESAQIRTDRMSSGQVVTGLAVDGGHDFELAKETAIEDFLESAFSNTWATSPIRSSNFSLNLSTKKLIRGSGSFIDEGVKVGDFIQLSTWADAGNNTIIMATAVTDLEVTFAGPSGMVTAATEPAAYQICDKLSIGTTKKSLTVEKTFTDLTNKALIYRGCLVSNMELNIEYGSMVNGSFDTQGNGYVAADAADEFASYLEYISAPATSQSMNGSVDMPFLATNVSGAWEQDTFCIQKLNISMNNNLTTQTCIGRAAPENYSLGTAQVQAELSSYLKDSNWQMLAKKLTQESFALGFLVKNVDGFYGMYLPALQVSFDDPQSGGQNQDVTMDMTGTAKVGTGGVSALTIYRAPTV